MRRKRGGGGKALKEDNGRKTGAAAQRTAAGLIGDTIYDLFVRGDVLERHDESVQKLHKRAVARVNAAAQARAFDRVEPLLTQEEADVARRARNAHSRPPKHQDPGDYSRATALEALCGYLYLCGRHDRLGQLLGEINREEQNG